MNCQWDKLTNVCADELQLRRNVTLDSALSWNSLRKNTAEASIHNLSGITLWEVIADEKRHVRGRKMCK